MSIDEAFEEVARGNAEALLLERGHRLEEAVTEWGSGSC
jgi:hypothetical protein